MNAKPPGFFKARLHQIKSTKTLVVNILKDSKKAAKDTKQEYKGWLSQAREKIKNPANANFELGKNFYNDGLVSDAIMRFKLALLMNKELDVAKLWLAKSLIAKGDFAKAREHLSSYAQNSEKTTELKYFSSLLDPKKNNIYPNSLIIQEYFRLFSKFFDQNYCYKFNYQGFAIIHQYVKNRIGQQNKNLKVLEIGTGPGILAEKLKSTYKQAQITGIDYCPTMIDICQKRTINIEEEKDDDVIDLNNTNNEENIHIYDKLIRKDFLESIETLENNYDVIMCRGFMHYVEKPEEILNIISKLLRKNGIFIFYVNNNYNRQKKQEIMMQGSFPYYLEIRHHDKTTFEKYSKNSDLKLDLSEKFMLEDDIPATLYLFEKQ